MLGCPIIDIDTFIYGPRTHWFQLLFLFLFSFSFSFEEDFNYFSTLLSIICAFFKACFTFSSFLRLLNHTTFNNHENWISYLVEVRVGQGSFHVQYSFPCTFGSHLLIYYIVSFFFYYSQDTWWSYPLPIFYPENALY
jgi:hypothetical protein